MLGSPARAADLPAGPGREILLRACTRCHTQESFSEYRHTREEYQTIVYRMGDRGAQATVTELDQIAEYLAKNFPKADDPNTVNVNTASAKEIETRLGLTSKEAEAVVAYRESHGNFHAAGDLFVIYGVDGKKIQAAKERIAF